MIWISNTHVGLTQVPFKSRCLLFLGGFDTDAALPPLSSAQGEKIVRMTKATTRWICPSAQSRRKVGPVRPASADTLARSLALSDRREEADRK